MIQLLCTFAAVWVLSDMFLLIELDAVSQLTGIGIAFAAVAVVVFVIVWFVTGLSFLQYSAIPCLSSHLVLISSFCCAAF